MESVSVGYVGVVRILLRVGVGINIYFNEFKESVFILVCYKGLFYIIFIDYFCYYIMIFNFVSFSC